MRETHKTPNDKFDNTFENQFETTKTGSHFSLETHCPSQFRYRQNAINPICETQSTKIHLQPHSMASTDSEIKRQLKTLAIESRGICESQLSDVASNEINNNKQITSLLFDLAENTSNCSAPNSNYKPRPTLHKNRPTTLIDMMQFVAQWFDFEENLVDESAESERINRIENELSKNDIGDDGFSDELGDIIVDCDNSVQEKLFTSCDVLGDIVVECGNSIQEKLVDCFDVKNVGENVKNVEEDGKIVLSIASDWFNFEEGENDCCDVLGDIIVDCDNNVQEKGSHEQFGSQSMGNSQSVIRDLTEGEPVLLRSEINVKNLSNIIEEIDLRDASFVVRTIDSTLSVGFENFKSKGRRSRGCGAVIEQNDKSSRDRRYPSDIRVNNGSWTVATTLGWTAASLPEITIIQASSWWTAVGG
ncbi:hypothetical protein LWI28_011704 [Acer negundo]|uniref:Uncharacterized protein n=1 Tax=Acer negundo TaxID=4023 RepID=A0AAD5IVE1_ACENE|nr:hypothetical protein LWI28_011704 [Acer negundo]